jgi:hypothetical protein
VVEFGHDRSKNKTTAAAAPHLLAVSTMTHASISCFIMKSFRGSVATSRSTPMQSLAYRTEAHLEGTAYSWLNFFESTG